MIEIDTRRPDPLGDRDQSLGEGQAFFDALVAMLREREPALFTLPP